MLIKEYGNEFLDEYEYICNNTDFVYENRAGTIIDKQYGDWLNLWSDLTKPQLDNKNNKLKNEYI